MTRPGPRTLAELFRRWYGGVNFAFSGLAGMSDGLWLGFMDGDALDALDELHYGAQTQYLDVTYNRSGLRTWERQFADRHLQPRARVLVNGAGGGREVIVLAADGHDVVGAECNRAMVDFAQTLVRDEGLDAEMLVAPRDGWPEARGPFDAVIVGWGAYTHIRSRALRVAFLAEARHLVSTGAPLLVSFYERTPRSIYFRLVRHVAGLVRRLRGRPAPEYGDSLVPNYADFFTRTEIASELRDGGFDMVEFRNEEYAYAVGLAR